MNRVKLLQLLGDAGFKVNEKLDEMTMEGVAASLLVWSLYELDGRNVLQSR